MASEDFDAYSLPILSPQKQLQPPHKKSWLELRGTVRETRKAITRLSPTLIPSNFQFRNYVTETGEKKTRLYFLGCLEKGRDSTLLKVDIPEESIQSSGDSVFENLESFQPIFAPCPLFGVQPTIPSVAMSREEQLMRERKRLGTYGITSFELHTESGQFVIPANNGLYSVQDKFDLNCLPSEMPTEVIGARLDPKICPSNPNLVAFIHDMDIWLTNLATDTETRLTFSHKGDIRDEDDSFSSGVPSFVIQEEFDRYTGFWWAPQSQTLPDGGTVYHLLYEEVDESHVDITPIFATIGSDSNAEYYRYPKAGTVNATSTLKLIQITIPASHSNAKNEISRDIFSMKDSLVDICPWVEYISRAGWTADGRYIYAVIMDRLQQRHSVLLISRMCFFDDGAKVSKSECPYIQCIYEESSDIWVNVHDLLYFFPQTKDDEISFLIGSEKTGYRHLYLVTSRLYTSSNPMPSSHVVTSHPVDDEEDFDEMADEDDPNLPNQMVKESAVTSGSWVVLPKELWVDEKRGLVFFMGLKDTPLESHLYVCSYLERGEPIRLTQPGYSHSVQLSQDFTKFVSVFSSLQSPTQSTIFKLSYSSYKMVFCTQMGVLTPSTDSTAYTPPIQFQYPSRAGHTAYGLYFLPKVFEQGRRYPTVLFVYGGPQVQMVTNSFKGHKFLRLHTLAAEGYVVVVIDGRGSNNRGLEFEGILKNKLGTVEISDQVEGLLWLASQTDFIDTSRVAVHGWSYGGYLSLMGMAQRKDIFKVAIAGAPVVSWELYDTGYTERYIGLPQNNPEVYKAGSVLTYIESLPDFETRLLLIHGLIDENVHFSHSSALINQLVNCCKPHQLQVYPNERHGIRNHEASEHYKTTVLKFLQDHL